MRFIESGDGYSVYARPDGTEVFLAHGHTMRYLVEYDRDWMLGQWQAHSSKLMWTLSRYALRNQFLDWLREQLTEPDVVDDLRFCENCNEPEESDNGDSVGCYDDSWACQSCIDEYYLACHDCDRIVRDTTSVYDDDVCARCLDNYYSFCDHCDEYYHHDYSSDHDHNQDCDCESPAQRFFVRHGERLLGNDDRATVTLPAGHIDDEGRLEIKRYLRRHDDLRDRWGWEMGAALDELGNQWQTSEGNYTKRLSKAFYKGFGIKLSPEIISQVGCIASDHSRAIDFAIEVTRNLNMDPGDFAHEGSCWWGEYSASRCALKSNGGWGLRTFGSYDRVNGRAWVMPLKANVSGSLRPTFNSETPDAYVVFNGYGDLEGYNSARIVAHMAGMTYRKIEFACSPMYINNESGYLVAPDEVLANQSNYLSLSLSDHADLYHAEQAATELVDA